MGQYPIGNAYVSSHVRVNFSIVTWGFGKYKFCLKACNFLFVFNLNSLSARQLEPRLLSRNPLRYQAAEVNLGEMAYQASMVSKIRTLSQPNLFGFLGGNRQNFLKRFTRRKEWVFYAVILCCVCSFVTYISRT